MCPKANYRSYYHITSTIAAIAFAVEQKIPAQTTMSKLIVEEE